MAQQILQIKTEKVEDVFKILNIENENWEYEHRQDIIYKNEEKRYVLDVRFQIMHEKNLFGKKSLIGSYMIIDDITEMREELERREYIASHDALTGLYNHQCFIKKTKELLSQNDGITYAIAMTNINQFKLYNEVFGKKAGDELLKKIAAAFQEKIHIKNIVYGRYEADRFVACIPIEYCTEAFVKQMEIDKPIYIEHFQITNYVGFCKIEGETDIELLCDRAAIAFNTIKGDAELRLMQFDSTMRDVLLRDRALTAAFPKALANNEIQIFIQPQINQFNNKIVGGEVLARWITSTGEVISPGDFIPVLEKNGLITALDMCVWEKACEQIKLFMSQGKEISLSVNISTYDFYRIDLYETFTGLVKKYGIEPKFLKLEITESSFFCDLEKQLILINKLKDAGFIIGMDDFGSGYSSLNSLKDIPVDILKMDLKFIENIKNRDKGRIIIQNIVRLAKELKLGVIAEGVETQEQLQIMKDVGCAYIQGYYYGKPMSVEKFHEYCNKMEYEEIQI